jgi:hypothetical protein
MRPAAGRYRITVETMRLTGWGPQGQPKPQPGVNILSGPPVPLRSNALTIEVIAPERASYRIYRLRSWSFTMSANCLRT